MHRAPLNGIWAIICVCALWAGPSMNGPLCGQAGLRESLLQLDSNQDGRISPDEITPLARPYLERIMRERRMSINENNDINRLLDAARVYFALRNGSSGRDIQPGGKQTIIPFGPKPNDPLVAEFGLPTVKYRYVRRDLDEAEQTMRRYDANRDGFIDVREASRNRWTHRDPFEMDFNKDGRLNIMELAQRYARRRMLDASSQEVWNKARRTGGLLPRNRRVASEGGDDRDRRRRGDSGRRDSGRRDFGRRDSGRRDPGRRRSGNRLAGEIMGRFDANRNGRLEYREAERLGIPAGKIDSDFNGELSRDELYAYLEGVQKKALAALEGVPNWFTELDKNRDGQVAMAEFTTEWTDAKFQEFSSYDANRDGLLTANEVSQSKPVAAASFANTNADPIPPGKTIVSEIEISEDYLVGDLNVLLSITHSYDSALHAYLTGPRGQRIELFSEVGGTDDHFDETLFDDQARTPITKSRPPFRGPHIPKAATTKQPSLSSFNGKSIKGVWQLVIRNTRNDRFGMLHRWALIVKPQVQDPGRKPGTPDPPQTDAAPDRSRGKTRS